jgi:hypothetical protein
VTVDDCNTNKTEIQQREAPDNHASRVGVPANGAVANSSVAPPYGQASQRVTGFYCLQASEGSIGFGCMNSDK